MHALLLCIWQNHRKEVEGGSQSVWRPNVVVCCVESKRNPVHIASLEEQEFVRQVSLLAAERNKSTAKAGIRKICNEEKSPRARDTNLFWPSPDRISLFC